MDVSDISGAENTKIRLEGQCWELIHGNNMPMANENKVPLEVTLAGWLGVPPFSWEMHLHMLCKRWMFAKLKSNILTLPFKKRTGDVSCISLDDNMKVSCIGLENMDYLHFPQGPQALQRALLAAKALPCKSPRCFCDEAGAHKPSSEGMASKMETSRLVDDIDHDNKEEDEDEDDDGPY